MCPIVIRNELQNCTKEVCIGVTNFIEKDDNRHNSKLE